MLLGLLHQDRASLPPEVVAALRAVPDSSPNRDTIRMRKGILLARCLEAQGENGEGSGDREALTSPFTEKEAADAGRKLQSCVQEPTRLHVVEEVGAQFQVGTVEFPGSEG